ncbi:hypothetical protein MtrunA17_Chr7g0262301 [Medicago truncatula]|uniref:Eukaryotic translation initiation factor 3 subunit A n=1 Tax=Medicago truncatula TaxID=3880 RepID=A0A396H4X2_MEDTR|nr:hypothetical protein MtrunA17_Chr7g0262301 [Medicago truncatula]
MADLMVMKEIEDKASKLRIFSDDVDVFRMENPKFDTIFEFDTQGQISRESLMQLTLVEQLRERQEMEKKLQKLAKTMDHLERAKREEAAPLIEAAYQHGLVEERILYEREQQQEVELSRQRHAADLIEKERLSRMMGCKEIYQERVVSHRQVEFNRLMREREERISRILPSRKQEREKMRKLKYYLELEEERKQKLLKEEEARKRQDLVVLKGLH